MQVIERFSIENANYRKIFYRKCKLSKDFLPKMQVIVRFSIGKAFLKNIKSDRKSIDKFSKEDHK